MDRQSDYESDLLHDDDVYVFLTDIGIIVEKQIHETEKRYSNIKVDCYVIMPTHIHLIVEICNENTNKKTAGASPRPTIMDIVCSLKSVITVIANGADNIPARRIF